MDRDKSPTLDSPDEERVSPEYLRDGCAATETIDLNGLFGEEVTDSGSFDIRGGIWATTFGKLLEALPIPVLLLDRSLNIAAANQAWRKVSTVYEKILGNPFSRLFRKSPVALEAESLLKQVFSTRKTATWEALVEIDQSKIWGRFTFRSIRIKEQRFLLALVEDLSLERKQRLQERKYGQELEKRVKERTEELIRLNEELYREIADRKRSEEALRASEERYRRLFDDAPVMYVITRNEEGVPLITDCNDMFLRCVGQLRAEVLGKPLADFYSPESRSDLLEAGGYARALAGEFFIGERQLLRRDGGLVSTLLHTATEVDSSGEVIGTRAMFVDITERKRAEDALKESEERFRGVFENNHAVMLIIDPETGRILDGSPGACAFYGFTREELAQKRISDINTLSPEEIRERMEMAKSQHRRYFDFRHRLASGEIRDVEVCSGPIVIGGKTFLFSIITDVTERKLAERALLRSESKYRALFDESRDGVYSVLRDGKLTDANQALLDLFGYSREEAIGKDVRDLFVDPNDQVRFREEIEERGFVKDFEVKLRRKDGTERDCLLTSSVQFGDDRSFVGYRGMIRDTTNTKALQRQLLQAQKMEAIGTLAGGIAHDFNNILTVILGFSELLLIGKDQRDPSYEDLQKICQAARNGADLVKRILTFSRKSDINPRPLNLNHEIEQAKKLLSRMIPKMVEIELALSDQVAKVNADPAQVEQILMNLVVNARDAMPDGGRLTISTANVVLDEEYCRLQVGAKPGDYVLLVVSDTGHGIDTETLQHIFEPFFTTKETGRGTGLGLAMVYGIVKQHGGYITCDSEPGQGAVFKIYLPAMVVEEIAPERPEQETISKGGKETILLVDDEELIRDLGKRILERSGYRVLTAANGKEALALYNTKKALIALVILDLIMPEMGGRQCLEELLKIDPNIRVLIASGFTAGGQTQEATDAGARGFVGKPYNLKEMLQSVREVLDKERTGS